MALDLGGAALQRCGHHTVPSVALAAGGFVKIRIKPINLSRCR
jgi:hypothetical protein